MLAVDLQRTGETERYLGGTSEVFNVARCFSGIDGIAEQMVDLFSSELFNVFLSGGDYIAAVVIRFVTRDVF
jgi:hypothetical protein